MIDKDDYSQKKDEELISLTLKDNNYYRYLVERYEAKLMRYITRISYFGQEDAEDILQNAFIKIYKNLNEYNKKFPFSSWAYRIVHNETISHMRKINSRPKIINQKDSDFLVSRLKSEADFEEKIDKKYLAEEISKLIGLLDEKYRQVLVLKYLENKNYEEISDILKKPVGTISTLISRAKKQLKSKITISSRF